MHLHILGIAGTFMGGIAQIAQAAGHTVTGPDRAVYPPMSDQLAQAGIVFENGFELTQLDADFDQLVVGNIMSRGMPIVERMLNDRISYTSAPQWLYENVLKDRRVLAVSGTHGKTTTASMLAWILEFAGLQPGFLIGGVPENFSVSARLGESPWFVIEADEYDTAFFDKRSKFVHYHPETLIINNLEFDHADIFVNLEAIQTQFHHLLRMLPADGSVIYPQDDQNVATMLERGCWSQQVSMGNSDDSAWQYTALQADCGRIEIFKSGQSQGVLDWDLLGKHNAMNALAAIAASATADISAQTAIQALSEFKGVKRRMQLRGTINGIRIYDDFAHHPTAIKTTLEGLRAKVGAGRILVAFEPRSNTMRMGIHKETLGAAFDAADEAFVLLSRDLDWGEEGLQMNVPSHIFTSVDALLEALTKQSRSGDSIIIMSNGGFENLPVRLLDAL